jgi:hypothetical protein
MPWFLRWTWSVTATKPGGSKVYKVIHLLLMCALFAAVGWSSLKDGDTHRNYLIIDSFWILTALPAYGAIHWGQSCKRRDFDVFFGKLIHELPEKARLEVNSQCANYIIALFSFVILLNILITCDFCTGEKLDATTVVWMLSTAFFNISSMYVFDITCFYQCALIRAQLDNFFAKISEYQCRAHRRYSGSGDSLAGDEHDSDPEPEAEVFAGEHGRESVIISRFYRGSMSHDPRKRLVEHYQEHSHVQRVFEESDDDDDHGQFGGHEHQCECQQFLRKWRKIKDLTDTYASTWGISTSLLLLVNLLYAVDTWFGYALVHSAFLSTAWCKHNHGLSFAFQYSMHVVRIAAIVYGPTLVNSKAQGIKAHVLNEFQSSREHVMHLATTLKHIEVRVHLCWVTISDVQLGGLALSAVCWLLGSLRYRQIVN